jgi:hypothetical protein
LNHPGRKSILANLIRCRDKKKEAFPQGFLDRLAGPSQFSWHCLPAIGTTGGLLLGVKDEFDISSNMTPSEFSLSCVVQNKKGGFMLKLLVVYGSPYEDKKTEFIDELHLVLAGWQGPVMVGGGGDFNLSRFCSDKNNGMINQRFADYFNDWVNKWGLVELNPCNRKFSWSNNQLSLIRFLCPLVGGGGQIPSGQGYMSG